MCREIDEAGGLEEQGEVRRLLAENAKLRENLSRQAERTLTQVFTS